MRSGYICTSLLPDTPNTIHGSNESTLVHICHIFSNKLNSCLVCTKNFVTPHKENRLVRTNICYCALKIPNGH